MMTEALMTPETPALPYPLSNRPEPSEIPEIFKRRQNHLFFRIAEFMQMNYKVFVTEQTTRQRGLKVHEWILVPKVDDQVENIVEFISYRPAWTQDNDMVEMTAWMLWSWFTVNSGPGFPEKETADYPDFDALCETRGD